MTRKEKEILRQAGIIIRNELKQGRKVSIPDLGKFTFGVVTCIETPPWLKGDRQRFLQRVPRFRVYRELREIVKERKYLT